MANNARNKPGREEIVETEVNPLLGIQAKYEQNKKRINTVVTVCLVAVLGIVAYFFMYKAPREKDAAKAVYYAERYFAMDSSNLVLNGDGQHNGVLKVMKKYSGTQVANLCNYYAGISYLNLGDNNNAIKYLKAFKAEGSGVATVAAGALGDAYMNSGKVKEAIKQYEKASGDKNDNVLSPIYLQRLAIAYEKNKQVEDAKSAYQKISDLYPQSMQAREVEKTLARLGKID